MGEYDFLVMLDVEGLALLSKTVDTIRNIRGVTATHTIIGAELHGGQL
jgi:DNA-binding Lrp family transcriptional regulator